MRKLAASLVLLVSIGVFFGVGVTSSGGCSRSPCEAACEHYNAMKCGTTCDCSACNGAPPECDSYYECVRDSIQYCIEVDINISCPPTDACRAYQEEHCK